MPNIRTTTEYNILKFMSVHGDLYDYSKVNYTNNETDVCIVCPTHGEFYQRPSVHKRGSGCPKCSGKAIPTNAEFISNSKSIHGDRYNYSKVDYKSNQIKVCIICQEHGEYFVRPNSHLKGTGCPYCRESKGEYKIRTYLKNIGLDFMTQYRNDKCRDQRTLPFDFYIPSFNLLIEYDGVQHFKPIDRFGGNVSYLKVIRHDIIKNEFANSNNYNLIRIPYWKYDEIEDILKSTFL